MLKTEKEVNALCKELKNNGYNEFTPPDFMNKFKDLLHAFQKRFDDEIGKKFFIDIYIYNELIHPHTKESFGFAVEASTQLTFTEKEYPVNIELFAGWDIKEIESKVQEIWEKCNANYYEKW